MGDGVIIAKKPATEKMIGQRAFVEPALLFIGLVAVLSFLRSHNLTAVDGAVRAFSIYHDRSLQFHGASHVLYPVYVLVWTQATARLGISTADPISFIRVVQVMNCVFASFCAAVLLLFLRSMGVSRGVAIFASLGWVFSRAVLLHATNSAEPLAGLAWSVSALGLMWHACHRQKLWLVPVAGVFLAAAMASYQSMVLMAVACGILALIGSWQGGRKSYPLFKAVLLLSGGFIVGLVAVYGIPLRLQGATTLSSAWNMFFASPDRHVFGQFTLSKFVNLSTGFAANTLYCFPTQAGGLRSLFRDHRTWVPWFLVSLLSASSIYLGLLIVFLRKCVNEVDNFGYLSCAVMGSLLLGIVLLCYWTPTYEKLWIQPLWLLFLTGALFLHRVRCYVPWLARAAGTFVVVLVATNLVVAVHDSRGSWPNVEQAAMVNSCVSDKDLVITDWSPMSSVYENMWARPNTWNFISATGTYRSRTPEELRQKIQQAEKRNGSVYFLGLLNQDRSTWDLFLGARCGIPFDSLATYRNNSVPVAYFQSGRQVVELRRLEDAEWHADLRGDQGRPLMNHPGGPTAPPF